MEWITGLSVIVSAVATIWGIFKQKKAKKEQSAKEQPEGVAGVIIGAVEKSEELIGKPNTKKLKKAVEDASSVFGNVKAVYDTVKRWTK